MTHLVLGAGVVDGRSGDVERGAAGSKVRVCLGQFNSHRFLIKCMGVFEFVHTQSWLFEILLPTKVDSPW